MERGVWRVPEQKGLDGQRKSSERTIEVYMDNNYHWCGDTHRNSNTWEAEAGGWCH